MIKVKIEINEKVIEEVIAVNVSENFGLIYGKGKQIYEINKSQLFHNFEDGAIILAFKMLDKRILENSQKLSQENSK